MVSIDYEHRVIEKMARDDRLVPTARRHDLACRADERDRIECSREIGHVRMPLLNSMHSARHRRERGFEPRPRTHLEELVSVKQEDEVRSSGREHAVDLTRNDVRLAILE